MLILNIILISFPHSLTLCPSLFSRPVMPPSLTWVTSILRSRPGYDLAAPTFHTYSGKIQEVVVGSYANGVDFQMDDW